ncbi:hypothetical protein DPM13_16030 [Paracoccus mutanolyticus]|uniref:PIG-L family deacetylase n=1 Tax=Paracoccus mutanolyticus TaxID=1499308 RepID=A0ABN5M8M7_9RHOB|nr:PIG-L family deacetylase [Paracoccus mutanolyticus]AWX93960.1 hypothetical protein DPM13_16030 [Paracoccus mutanolyticus]
MRRPARGGCHERVSGRAGKCPGISVDDLLGGRALVVLSSHPDDGTLGCGALLQGASSQGVPCHVVCVTDGSRSHSNSTARVALPAPGRT